MKLLWKNVTLWSLVLGHFCVDMLAGAMPIVVGLYLKDSLQLDLTQIGLLLAVYKLSSSLTQPLFGYLSDRYGGRWFAVGGVLWMAIFQGAVGFMPDLSGALVMGGLAGLGSAAFHPQGASGANVAAGENKTAGVALFMLGGNMGFAVGPLLAALVMGRTGAWGTAVLAGIAVLIVPFLYLLTGQAQRAAIGAKKAANWRIELNPLFSSAVIVSLILVMSLRAWSQESFSAFLPQFFVEISHFSKTNASALSSLMLLTVAFGSLAGGILADRIGGVRVMVGSMLISAPLMLAMFLLGDWRAYFVAPFLGFTTGAAWPPMLVLAQSLFPKNAGVGSGVALGFVFAMGGLGLNLTGWLAEPHRLGLYTAMLLLCIIPIATALLALPLPSVSRRGLVMRQRVRAVAATTGSD
ncbi:MAG: MFS transporter [Chloroflexi bacterium]|nr:MFS transporter [Chloroflexota bacterium]